MATSFRSIRAASKAATPDALIYGRKPNGDPIHDRMCAGKKGYDTKSQAKSAAKRTVKSNPDDRKGMQQYLCPYCDLWHNGHSNERSPE